MVDNDRQWFKSHHGLDVSETPRDHAFCAHAIHDSANVFIVEDARQDNRFFDNPLVTGNPHVIFYAGVPLTNKTGLPLGTLCVIDNKPNKLSAKQIEALRALANQVMNLLELRKSKKQLEEAVLELERSNKELEQFAYIAAHDLKSPLNNISSLTTLLKEDYIKQIAPEGRELVTHIETSANQLRNLIDGMLHYSTSTKIIKDEKIEINLTNLKENLVSLLSFENKLEINLVANQQTIFSNSTALKQILINLTSNAVKYNDKPITEIDLIVDETDNNYQITFTDNGPGIPEEYHLKIFELFEVLVSEDKFGQKGNGIGLATVKKMVENLGGSIKIVSEMGKGTTFIFTIGKKLSL